MDENKQLSRIGFLARACGGFGGLLVALSFIQAFQTDENAVWFVSFGLAGGIFIELSIYFYSSVAQWPVVRRFLNTQAIKNAYKQQRS